MKRPDEMDEAREWFVDGLIDAAIESERQRHMEQKGKALKERVGVALGEKEESHWELMMGLPIGWTDLKPLGMDKFQAWCASHGKPCHSDPTNKKPLPPK